jgi:hypothetical protein
MEDYRHIEVPIGPDAATAGTDASAFSGIAEPGTYVLEAAQFMPDAAIAADGSNYAAIGLEIGGTDAVTDIDSSATSYVAGTPVDLTLASGSAIEVDGLTGSLESTCVKTGTGVAVSGSIVCRLRKLR